METQDKANKKWRVLEMMDKGAIVTSHYCSLVQHQSRATDKREGGGEGEHIISRHEIVVRSPAASHRLIGTGIATHGLSVGYKTTRGRCNVEMRWDNMHCRPRKFRPQKRTGNCAAL